MKSGIKELIVISIAILLLSGCGGGGGSLKGVFIDDVVSGVRYVNGTNTGYTDENGEFPYSGGVVEFYLGNIKIGQVSSLKSDNKVFVQDIVGLDRTNVDDAKVLKIATLLQSLDTDSSTDKIIITRSVFNDFNDETGLIDDVDVDALLAEKNIEKVSETDVKRHMNNVLKNHGVKENNENNNEEIKISALQTTKGLNSSITITFNEDIKRFQNQDIIQLENENSQIVTFDIEHDFNKVTLNLTNDVESYDNYKLTVDVSKLSGYGITGTEDENLELTFGKAGTNQSIIDLVPPVIEFNEEYKKEINTNKTIATLKGKVFDNTSLEKIVLNLNNETQEFSNIIEDFDLDLSLKGGNNSYEVMVVDTNGNESLISGNIYLGDIVAAGNSHSGALYNEELYTWGRNNYSQTGLGYTSELDEGTVEEPHPSSPIKVTTPTKFVALSFNQNFSLALDENGDVYSWGYDKNGELGRGDDGKDSCGSSGDDCRKTIEKVQNLDNVVYVSAGLSHSLAIKNDGSVWAFGSNKDGELGTGTASDYISSAVKVDFNNQDLNIVQVSGGSDFSIALDDNGELWAWGKNNYGQMGQGEEFGTSDQLTPIKVYIPNNEKISSIATGTGHVLVLSENGNVYGWGNNATSQIGYYGYQYKDTVNAWERRIYTPTLILENDVNNPIVEIYAGGNSSYILRADKKIYPWGQYGETDTDGSQDYNNLDFPEDKLTAITSVKDIAAGALHVAAVQENNTIFTWRWSFEGSLGGGETTADRWFYNYPIRPVFEVDSGDSGSENPTDGDGEDLAWSAPGGNATVAYDVDEPFMKISDNISENEITGVSQGRELFLAQWQVAPGNRPTLDGLGPLFNANACTACHVSNGRVVPYFDDGTTDQSFLFRVGNEAGDQHPIFGGQLQTQATSGEAEASITWTRDSNDEIEFITSVDLDSDGFNIGGRISPHLLGMGLLDLVSEETILEYEDINDSNSDGISGRAHWVMEEGQRRIGRFGWKAINSSLRTQNAGALHQDMGLTTPVNPNENCTSNQTVCQEEENGGSPEVTEGSLQAIVDFMSALGVPERRINNQTTFEEGAEIFETIGCASCHRPTMTTASSSKFGSLSNQKIYPYTDLLLHDMGEGLADGVKEKDASGSEFRTSPLWGIGIVEAKQGTKFLHDGRASSIKEAIEYHGGEAQNARDSFIQLETSEQEKLLEFLRAI